MGKLPDNVFVIRDAETLKAISDPLRLKIFGLLQERTMTVKQLAEALDVAQTRLYYHMNQLESLGLIKVANTRVVAGIIEKQYRASAKRLTVDRTLFSPGAAPVNETIEALLTAILDGVRDSIRESVHADLIDPQRESPREGGLLLGRTWFRLTREEAGQLYDRFVGALAEFEGRHPDQSEDDVVSYESLVGLYPVVEPVDDLNQDDDKNA
jgi:DNA-binding transcriptional ArsR family regulator